MKTHISFKDRSTAEILMLIPNMFAALIDLFFCIPFIGRVLKWLWNSILTFLHFVIGMLEFLLWKLGVQPEKNFRIGFFILRDENNLPLANPDAVLPAIQKAQQIYQQAKVKILPAFPIPKKLPESGEIAESSRWVRIQNSQAGSNILIVGCNLPAMIQDVGIPGMLFQYHTLGSFFDTGFRRLTGYGAPVTVFIVKEIVGFAGCSLGWLSDYVTVEHNHLFTSAHELGHACNLLHRADKANLMHPSSGKQETIVLTDWQIALLRASRHVTLF